MQNCKRAFATRTCLASFSRSCGSPQIWSCTRAPSRKGRGPSCSSYHLNLDTDQVSHGGPPTAMCMAPCRAHANHCACCLVSSRSQCVSESTISMLMGKSVVPSGGTTCSSALCKSPSRLAPENTCNTAVCRRCTMNLLW